MRSYKYFLVSALLAAVIFGAGLYSSCSKDACKGVTCINKGLCSGGNCTCQKGIGGLSCELIYRDAYANLYKGSGTSDSGDIYIDNTMTFTSGADSDYTQMQVAWNNFGPHIITMPITLANFSSSGATFTVTSTKIDTVTYTGTGTVSSTSASMNLTASHPNSAPVSITLHSFIRQ